MRTVGLGCGGCWDGGVEEGKGVGIEFEFGFGFGFGVEDVVEGGGGVVCDCESG